MLNRAHEALIAMSGERRFPGFLNTVELFTNESDIQLNVLDTGQPLAKGFFAWCREAIPGVGEGDAIDYTSGGDLFRVGSRSFFQVNRFLTDALSELAIGDAAGGMALDLYAGVGLFTLPLARRFETVQGVDSSWAATRALQFNAERAGVNVRVVNLGVEKFLADYSDGVDFAVADPPRAGLGKKVTSELLRIRPSVLSLVSCDPATLARDLQALTAGGYGIEKITLIDLFPQTFHLETVVRLRIG
jgi:23S rRNA (uracil1939-C5)-methyltransferase